METIPSKTTLKVLYFNGFLKECEILATHGIDQLTLMYAGRGGALNVNRLTGKILSLFSQYLDSLYWVSCLLKNFNTSVFLGKHLQKAQLYDQAIFEKKIHRDVLSVIKDVKIKLYRVHISCMWTTTKQLYKDWAHLFDKITYISDEDWGNSESLGYKGEDGTMFILIEDKTKADYYVVLWGTVEPYTKEQLSRTIFFRTEPSFPDKSFMNENTKAEPLDFLRYYDYYDVRFPNCLENWLQKTTKELSLFIAKDDTLKHCISSVVSNKYTDPGHRYRIDLLKHMVKNIENLKLHIPDINSIGVDNANNLLHIYGFDNKLEFPSEYYYGPLPERNKSILMKYRYTLIAENHSIPGYMTEKIADGILSECLVFYWGCPNIEKYFPHVDGELPFVVLPMHDAVASFEIIKDAISNDWWSKKINAIRETKNRILSKFMIRHRIAQTIREDIDSKILGNDAMNLLKLAISENIFRGKNIPTFSTIIYTGARYEELKELVLRRTENRVKFEYFDGLSEMMPNKDTILVQEFSNKPIRMGIRENTQSLPVDYRNNDTPIHHYTVGFTRFCVKDVSFADTLPKAYVINLDRRTDRLFKFSRRFQYTGKWSYERFSAIDGNKLKVNGEFSKQIQYLFRNNDFCSKPSVIGCAMSHIRLWQKLVADDTNNSYVIYEDDVEFADNYAWKLWSLLQQITFDWDMLFLGHLMCYELQDTHRIENDELPKWESMVKYIVPNRTSWIGTASYMISKRGASKLLEYIEKNGVQHGIDYLIQLQFPNLLRAYGVNPMINFAEYASPLNPTINVDSDIQK